VPSIEKGQDSMNCFSEGENKASYGREGRQNGIDSANMALSGAEKKSESATATDRRRVTYHPRVKKKG